MNLLCPYCNMKVISSCIECKRELKSGWDNCPYCGTREQLITKAIEDNSIILNIISRGSHWGKDNLILKIKKNKYKSLYIYIPPFSTFAPNSTKIQRMTSIEPVSIKIDKDEKTCTLAASCFDYYKSTPPDKYDDFTFHLNNDIILKTLLMNLNNRLGITFDNFKSNILNYFWFQFVVWIYNDNISFEQFFQHPIIVEICEKYQLTEIFKLFHEPLKIIVSVFQECQMPLKEYQFFNDLEQSGKTLWEPILSILNFNINNMSETEFEKLNLIIVEILEQENIDFNDEPENAFEIITKYRLAIRNKFFLE